MQRVETLDSVRFVRPRAHGPYAWPREAGLRYDPIGYPVPPLSLGSDSLKFVFSTVGGLCSSEQLVDLVRSRFDQPMSIVARWLVGRAIVSVRSESQLLLPLFQFDLREMEILPAASAVIAELVGAFDDLEVSQWFAEANTWLGGRRPAELLRSEPSEVLMAARADRYIARG